MPDLREIKEAIENRSVIVIVGTGVSIAASDNHKNASWDGFLSSGIDKIEEISVEKNIDISSINEYKEKLATKTLTNLLEVAHYVQKTLEEANVYQKWIYNTIKSLTVKKNELIQAIYDLNCPIFTTNYDNLLEAAGSATPITWKDGRKIRDLLQTHECCKKYILHLHGYYEDPETVVLGLLDYEKIKLNEMVQNTLNYAFWGKRILFIGVGPNGLNDPNFSSLFEYFSKITGTKWAENHFLLLPDDKNTGIIENDFFLSIKKVIYEDIKKLLPTLQKIKPANLKLEQKNDDFLISPADAKTWLEQLYLDIDKDKEKYYKRYFHFDDRSVDCQGYEIIEKCKQLVNDKNKNKSKYTILHGRPGIGKTVALLSYIASKIQNVPENYFFLNYSCCFDSDPVEKLDIFDSAMSNIQNESPVVIVVDGLISLYAYNGKNDHTSWIERLEGIIKERADGIDDVWILLTAESKIETVSTIISDFKDLSAHEIILTPPCKKFYDALKKHHDISFVFMQNLKLNKNDSSTICNHNLPHFVTNAIENGNEYFSVPIYLDAANRFFNEEPEECPLLYEIIERAYNSYNQDIKSKLNSFYKEINDVKKLLEVPKKNIKNVIDILKVERNMHWIELMENACTDEYVVEQMWRHYDEILTDDSLRYETKFALSNIISLLRKCDPDFNKNITEKNRLIFRLCDLAGVDFSPKENILSLSGAKFIGCNLERANFNNVTFDKDTEFLAVTLNEAIFSMSEIKNSKMQYIKYDNKIYDYGFTDKHVQ